MIDKVPKTSKKYGINTNKSQQNNELLLHAFTNTNAVTVSTNQIIYNTISILQYTIVV